jgi:hypothetical protein
VTVRCFVGLLTVELLVGAGQWLAGEAGGDARVEAGAVGEVLVGAAQPVADGLAGGLRPGDLAADSG